MFVQMSAYFAPAFFGHLFGKCLRRKKPYFEVLKLGLVVLGTFAVVWWPYLHSLDSFLEVRHITYYTQFSLSISAVFAVHIAFLLWNCVLTNASNSIVSALLIVLRIQSRVVGQIY